MLPLPPISTWWTFFPFFGIEVPDSQDPLSRPLFGDATLVSQATLQLLLDRPGLLQDKAYRDRQYPTYLAIRHEGIVNTHWFDEDRRNENFVAEVRQRAREVGGLITTAVLARHSTAYLCGLIEYEHAADSHMVLLKDDRSDYLLMWGDGSPTETWSLSHEEELFQG